MKLEALMVISLVVLLGILYDLTPFFTRAGIFFGVTVNPAFRDSDAGRAISRRYRKRVWVITALTGALCAAVAWFDIGAIPPLLILFHFQAVAVLMAFLAARRNTKPHAIQPAQVREAVLAARRDRMPGGVPVALGPFALLAGTAIAAYANWDRLPGRLPVHWGLTFKPDRWVDKTPQQVNGGLLSGALVCVLMFALAYAILTSRRVNTSGPAAERENSHRMLNVWILLGAGYLIALTHCVPLLVAIIAGPAAVEAMGPVMAAITILPFIALVYVLVRFARQGRDAADPGDLRGDATPDESWYGGMLYFNRQDPAIVVEKRFGFGYTLNMGNPVSWAITGMLVALPFLMSALG